MSQATLDSAKNPSESVSAPAAPARTNAPPVSYARPRPSRKQGINFRLVLFIGVVALPLLGIGWLLVKGFINKGITWHGNYAEVDLKALGNFPFDEHNGTRNDVPERWRNLDGKNIQLEGFMYSPRSAGSSGTEFQFVYNVTKCCFSGPPLVQERVYGHTSSGDISIYSQSGFVRINGILHVRVVRDDSGAIHSVFDLDVQHVQLLEG